MKANEAMARGFGPEEMRMYLLQQELRVDELRRVQLILLKYLKFDTSSLPWPDADVP